MTYGEDINIFLELNADFLFVIACRLLASNINRDF